jgi:hypothetical protein
MSNCVVLRLERGIMPIGEREGIMERIGEKQSNIERTQKRIFKLLTQCIKDIRKTVTASGLTIKDVRSESKNSIQAWILASMA